MVRIQTDLPNTSLRHEDAPNSELPLGSSTERQPPTRHEAMQKARLAVHRRSACSGLKACPWLEQGALRNTSDARRHAAKLCYRFGPLTPSARSANLIAGDGTKNGFPAPNKEPTTNQNHYLTAKAPYRFESISLQRGVCKLSVPLARSRASRHPRRGNSATQPLLARPTVTVKVAHVRLS